MRWQDPIDLIKVTVRGWYGGQTFWLGAAPALAFYGAFALAPTLVLAIAIAGVFFDKEAAQKQLSSSLEKTFDPVVVHALEGTLNNVSVAHSGWSASLVCLTVVLIASTGLFIQLQTALNSIWGVQTKPGRGLWSTIRGRFSAFVLVLGLGALLMLSLIANSVLAALHAIMSGPHWMGEPYLWGGVDWLILVALMTLLFSLIFKLLPDAIISWRDVCIGAFITALMCALGNFLFGLYLGRIAVAYAYGAAGSPLVIMLWVYYSFHVLLFGAEFTKQFAHKYGNTVKPADYAMHVPWQLHKD